MMKRYMKLFVLAAMLVMVAFVAGCGKSPVAPKTEQTQSIVKPDATVTSAAPSISGYRMIKAVAIDPIYDRNSGDTDYLITFDVPISYCPASWRGLAMTWYGVWYDQTANMGPHGFTANGNGTYRMRFLFGKGKARAFGITMSPSNWALYYR